jgi:plasmid stabilization system protein ParE
MARKVIWSFEATTDLEALAEYIAKDSTFYAAAFVQKVLDTSRFLNEFSERGRVVPELGNPNITDRLSEAKPVLYTVPCPLIIWNYGSS